jgi:Lon protease-like protein
VVPDGEIAIFPLPTVVLFPGVQTPLHLFEPRYRQMAEQVLAGSRRIGMVAVPPEHAAEMAGDPPVYPVGCAGTISRAHKLPDGRYNIVLAGTHRFRIRREPPRPEGRLYRVAEVERLDDPFDPAQRGRVAELRAVIGDQVAELVRRSDPARADPVSTDLFEGLDDAVFVNALANALPLGPTEKQGLLEADGVPERFERLEGLLSFRLAEPRGGRASGSGTLH